MFNKIAVAQALLRRLVEKQAGMMGTVLVGAGALGTAHLVNNGLKKAKEYNAGFQPGIGVQQ